MINHNYNRFVDGAMRLAPEQSKPKTHDDTLYLETRELQFRFLGKYYADLACNTAFMGAIVVMLIALIGTHNALVAALASVMFAVAAGLGTVARVPKGLAQTKGRLVRATIARNEKHIVIRLPEGEFVISRARSQYYRPLEYLCRNEDYESDFCVYQDPLSDQPFLVFRDYNEFFFLEPKKELELPADA